MAPRTNTTAPANANTTQKTAIRKRQRISNANRTMFLWVAIASAVVGAAVVVAIFLFQRMVFNEKVLAEKSNTVSTLRGNNESIEELKKNIRVLNTSQALIDSRLNGDEEPVQVILDALPDDANAAALGASLDKKLLAGNGITVEALTVDTTDGQSDGNSAETTTDDTAASSDTVSQNQIGFTFTVSSGDLNALKALLQRFERSIRVVNLTSLTLEQQGENKYSLTGQGYAYYEPAKTVDLKEKEVKQ